MNILFVEENKNREGNGGKLFGEGKQFLFWRINRAEKEKEEIFGGGTYF